MTMTLMSPAEVEGELFGADGELFGAFAVVEDTRFDELHAETRSIKAASDASRHLRLPPVPLCDRRPVRSCIMTRFLSLKVVG
jgi:hypothetical protein